MSNHEEAKRLEGEWQREFRCTKCPTEWIAVSSTLPCPACGSEGRWIDRVAESMPKDRTIVVVASGSLGCKKIPHSGAGYLHDANDDGPFDVDGVTYCGRCHTALPHEAPQRREPPPLPPRRGGRDFA